MPSTARIALVSSPRSGNTWLRRMLASMFGADERAGHTPSQIAWTHLPQRCLLQIHWHHVEPLITLLRQHAFQVVVLCRHPLDLLLSILHFALHSCDTACWLDGESGSENLIHGVTPRSQAFLDYATGPRAKALLAVSQQWWNAPGSHRVRYEDLAGDPIGQLERLASQLALSPVRSAAEAVSANTLEKLRPLSQNQHFWQGAPGHWRNLLPAPHAQHIAGVHQELFALYGYACDTDSTLDGGQADANWFNLDLQRFNSEMIGLRKQLEQSQSLRAELTELRKEVERSQSMLGELARLRTEVEESQIAIRKLRTRVQRSQLALNETATLVDQLRNAAGQLSTRLEPLETVGPLSLKFARGLHRLSTRAPRLSSAVKRVIGP